MRFSNCYYDLILRARSWSLFYGHFPYSPVGGVGLSFIQLIRPIIKSESTLVSTSLNSELIGHVSSLVPEPSFMISSSLLAFVVVPGYPCQSLSFHIWLLDLCMTSGSGLLLLGCCRRFFLWLAGIDLPVPTDNYRGFQNLNYLQPLRIFISHRAFVQV